MAWGGSTGCHNLPQVHHKLPQWATGVAHAATVGHRCCTCCHSGPSQLVGKLWAAIQAARSSALCSAGHHFVHIDAGMPENGTTTARNGTPNPGFRCLESSPKMFAGFVRQPTQPWRFSAKHTNNPAAFQPKPSAHMAFKSKLAPMQPGQAPQMFLLHQWASPGRHARP